MSSLLQPGGRIFNWACSSGWPGAFCTVSPEWLLSFYVLNDFRNIRVYHFHPIGEHSKWPNPTAAVFRYSPHFTRDPNYNPFSASMVETSHPSFVVAVAESTKYRAPEDWEMPMQSHYLFGDYPDWRDKYEEIEGLPFEFEKSDSADQESFPLPYQSDHFKFCGVIKGEAANVT